MSRSLQSDHQMVTILPQSVSSFYRVFVDDERAPAVALARVLAGVRGADHAVGDLAAGVAREATRGPAGTVLAMYTCTLLSHLLMVFTLTSYSSLGWDPPNAVVPHPVTTASLFS